VFRLLNILVTTEIEQNFNIQNCVVFIVESNGEKQFINFSKLRTKDAKKLFLGYKPPQITRSDWPMNYTYELHVY
jgi:hypothetical protein